MYCAILREKVLLTWAKHDNKDTNDKTKRQKRKTMPGQGQQNKKKDERKSDKTRQEDKSNQD
jgi:hypothetical protein